MAICTGPFFRRVADRKRKGMDVKITISARDGETGVGKTSLAVFLGKYLNTSRKPYRAEENATYNVGEFNALYDQLPRGSTANLEEAEQLDARRSNSHENVETARTWETRRVDEITSIMTLPSVAELDSRMERLHNFWINVTARGQCKIYAAHINDWSHEVYYEGLQQFRWPNMDHDEDYQRLVEMKEEWNDGDDTSDWVREHEVREEYEKELEQKQQEMRDRIVTSVYENTDLSQGEVGQSLPEDMRIKQQRVGQIVNGD
jgi:hypothetical protein